MTLRSALWLTPTWFVLVSGGCGGGGPRSASDGGAGAGGASAAGGAGLSGGTTGSAGSNGASDAGSSPPSGGAPGGNAGAAATTGAGGAAPAGGAGGFTPTGGAGGAAGDNKTCTFQITGAISAQIPTVGVIDWSTDLQGLTAARIEFSLDDPQADELNVGGGGAISVTEPKALMLGLKPNRSYTYRIVATAGDQVCVSPDQSLSTPAAPDAPVLTRVAGASAASRSNGYIITCPYNKMGPALIVDADGDVVWWSDAPLHCSRALMDWNGDYMWMLAANPTNAGPGEVRRVRMDGSGVEEITGLEKSHHDFAALPGGAFAFLLWDTTDDQASLLVERSAAGALSTVAHLGAGGYLTTSTLGRYHANALRYHASDDSYTVSDIYLPGISKLSRQGTVLWQVGSNCQGAPPSQCANAAIVGGHGHQLLDDGTLLYFTALNGGGSTGPSPISEYSLSLVNGTLTAKLVWSYTGQSMSTVLGDVQRLPNGDTLVTYSTDTIIEEVTPAGDVVQSLSSDGQFGYSSFRPSLYGPPS